VLQLEFDTMSVLLSDKVCLTIFEA